MSAQKIAEATAEMYEKARPQAGAEQALAFTPKTDEGPWLLRREAVLLAKARFRLARKEWARARLD